MTRPHVLVLHLRTTRPYDPTFQADLDELNQGALAAVAAVGASAELVAAAEVSTQHLEQTRLRADAVVVMGGEDVHPDLYGGQTRYPYSGHHDLAADLAQADVLRACLADGTPVLGICRGHQLLNVVAGGTLVQHLDSEAHRSLTSDPFVRTPVRLEGDGLAAHLEAARPVHCTHHQAVDSLGEGLAVAAIAPDGVVEAVVGTQRPVTGVQWHPEHPEDALTALVPLLRRLLEQAAVRTLPACPG